MDQQIEELPEYIHINQNDFSYRKHKKQKEEDIAICECKYNANDPDSACGERCLNVLTSTECTPNYCPCGVYCKNQHALEETFQFVRRCCYLRCVLRCFKAISGLRFILGKASWCLWEKLWMHMNYPQYWDASFLLYLCSIWNCHLGSILQSLSSVEYHHIERMGRRLVGWKMLNLSSGGRVSLPKRFQKCAYAETKLFKTQGRGWGLLADKDIKAGQFIIEYCGEVISWKEAKRRSHAYETQGLKDAFIISLNGSESIDATKKGSLARFINHSCQPNCETRKWNVLGEIRVGIFAKEDILKGTELGYDYNFEWYGGAKVRCLCGAVSCSGFLGAKSRGFQEDTYLWEDDDDRYSVEKIPLYDSAEDEPSSKQLKSMNSSSSEYNVDVKNKYSMTMNVSVGSEHQFESTALSIQPPDPVPMEDVIVSEIKTEASEEMKLYSEDTQQAFSQKNAMISRIRSNSACRNYHIGPGSLSNKRSKQYPNGRLKHSSQKQVDAKLVALLLVSKEAKEEILRSEEIKDDANSGLDSLYNEIRPAIEEYERDNQDSVATSVAEKWIEASCLKLKADFDFHFSIVKGFACNRHSAEARPAEGDNENGIKYLTN